MIIIQEETDLTKFTPIDLSGGGELKEIKLNIEIKGEEKKESKEQHNDKYYCIKNLKDFFAKLVILISLLSLTLPFIPIFGLQFLESPYFTIPVSIFSGLLIFTNIPIFTDYLHKKELSIKDLIDKEIKSLDIRTKSINSFYYIRVYRYLLCISSSFLFGLLVYYFEYEIKNSKLFWIEIFGIIFAYIASFRKIQQMISWILLFIIHKTKYRCKASPNSELSLSKLAGVI